MKTHFLNAIVAISLLVTMNSCSKEEQAEVKPVMIASDPDDFGYIDRGEGELYFYNDSLTSYTQANKNYLLLKPLSLEKYKNGELLDSVCNKDLALLFESKVRKTHNKVNQWGTKPKVSEEFAPIVTMNMGVTTIIKLSKMVYGLGFELNSPFKGLRYGITVQFFNSKLNAPLPHAFTSYLTGVTDLGPGLGAPGAPQLWAVESKTPFDQVNITFIHGPGAPTVNGPFDVSLAGFRYKLAK